MFFIIRFNAAFAALGIDPRLIPSDFREIGQRYGKQAGCTPQEAAILVLGELPMDFHMAANPLVANLWAHEKKLRLENPAIQQALLQIGWDLEPRT